MLYDALPDERQAINLNLDPATFDRLLTQLTRHSVLLVLGFLSATAWSEELVESGVIADLDWQPLIKIPVEERDQSCRQCRGRYVDPMADVDTSVAPVDSELQVAARESEVTETDALFTGDVRIQQGYRTIRADRVEVDRIEETATATGSVMLREPGVMIRGNSVAYDSRSEVAEIRDATYVLHARQMAGAAAFLTTLFRLTSGACPPNDRRLSA